MISPPVQKNSPKIGSDARRLTWFFALAYIAQGLSQQFGLIAQPLQYYMKDGLGMTAAEVSACLAVMMVPWVLKPIYGVVCDFVPLFGYRRKSYLIAGSLMATGAFLVMSISTALPVVLGCLLISAIGMAIGTALLTGSAVENGRQSGSARDYLSCQGFAYYSANIVASISAGVLCHVLAPTMALHWAATLSALPPLAVTFMTMRWLKEEKASLDLVQLKNTWVSLKEALKTRSIWLVALFLFCWNFSPSFGVPLYYYETNVLGFAQDEIGHLAAFNAAGMVLGAFLYGRFISKKLGLKRQLVLIVTIGTLSTLAYLFLDSLSIAIALEVLRGTANMIAILTLYGLAADVCPRRTEVTVMATLIAIYNFAAEFATFTGGQLFTHVFDEQLSPLVIVAALATAACALLIPFIKINNNPTTQALQSRIVDRCL